MMRRFFAALIALTLLVPAQAGLPGTYQPMLLGSGTAGACAQATSFFARLATQPTTARKLAYSTMICSMVTTGVWAKLDAFYVFAAADQATALTNLVQASYGATAVNSPTFTADTGFTNASGADIDSGFTPSTAISPQYALNSAFIAARTTTSFSSLQYPIIGNATDADSFIYPSHPVFSGNSVGTVNTGSFVNAASPGTVGLWTINRSASNLMTLFKDTTSIGTSSATPAGLPTGDILFGMDRGSAFLGTLLSGAIGGGLTSTDVANFYAAEHAYMQAVAGVP